MHANERNSCQRCWPKLAILALITALSAQAFPLFVYRPSHVLSSNNSLCLTHPRGKSFPLGGQWAVPPRGLTIFWCIYPCFLIFCLNVWCFLKFFAQVGLMRHVYNGRRCKSHITAVSWLQFINHPLFQHSSPLFYEVLPIEDSKEMSVGKTFYRCGRPVPYARVLPTTNHSDLTFCTDKNAPSRDTRCVTLRNWYLPEWDKDTEAAFHLSELSFWFLYMLSVRIKRMLLKKATTPWHEDLHFSSLAP